MPSVEESTTVALPKRGERRIAMPPQRVLTPCRVCWKTCQPLGTKGRVSPFLRCVSMRKTASLDDTYRHTSSVHLHFLGKPCTFHDSRLRRPLLGLGRLSLKGRKVYVHEVSGFHRAGHLSHPFCPTPLAWTPCRGIYGVPRSQQRYSKSPPYDRDPVRQTASASYSR